VKAIQEMTQMLDRDARQEPIVITYNNTVSITDLASIAKTAAGGSTDFVKGIFCYRDLHRSTLFPL
jgi:hypothetical protein